jgi:3D (Asp-Asp-Asp) domain-containing protein
MAKTINVSFSTAASFYLSVACTGYAALGASTPGDIVVGFNVSDVVEVIANVATVLLHMISLVQVITQVGCFTLIIHILYLYLGKWFCMYIYI